MLCGSVDPMGASAGDGEVSVVLGVRCPVCLHCSAVY